MRGRPTPYYSGGNRRSHRRWSRSVDAATVIVHDPPAIATDPMEELLGQMTQLLRQTQEKQQKLQDQQRQAEERTATLIERLEERRPDLTLPQRRPRVAELREGENIEKFLLTFERQMARAEVPEAVQF